MNSDPLATTITVLLVGAGATHFFQIGAMQWYARDWDRQNPLPEGPGEIYRALRSGLMFMVMGTGLLVVVNAGRIASGGPLAVSLCALLSAFAGYRLGLQIFGFGKRMDHEGNRRARAFLLGVLFVQFLIYAGVCVSLVFK